MFQFVGWSNMHFLAIYAQVKKLCNSDDVNFGVLNFHCNLLFVVSRGCKHSL